MCACPPGAEAGGPTGRRIIWFSTGRGSVDLNWIAGNREDKARFGGVAGDRPERGRNDPLRGVRADRLLRPAGRRRQPKRDPARHASERRPTIAWARSAASSLPTTRRATKRPSGRRTWTDGGAEEPPVGEYFATILRGRGLGQTRRVVGRKGETYLLDRPWRVAPQAGSLVLVHTGFWRNHLIGNRTVDGMTRRPALDRVHREHRQRQPGRADAKAGALSVRQLHDAGLLDAGHVELRASARCTSTTSRAAGAMKPAAAPP